MAPLPIRGVLFDMDGTLIDSNDAHARAWVRALAEGGFTIPFERVRGLIGMGGDKLLPEVTGGLTKDDPNGERIADRWTEIFEADELPKLRPFPGTRDLLLRLREEGFRLVVASSSEPALLEKLLPLTGAPDTFEEATSSGDAEGSKPDPDIFQAALDKLGLPPAETMVIGDTPFDLAAAKKAGIPMIGVRCGGWGDDDFKGAVAVYDDPADLLARYNSSPLAARVAAG
jgi:HAD superfamily hydrolase (TIGR01509 family)